MNTIAAKWEKFVIDVLPKDAPAVQRVEMRRAFYAGAASLLNIQTKIADDDVSMDAGVMILEGIHQELLSFTDTAH